MLYEVITDSVKYIDMNDEGVAMLEDNIFTTKESYNFV